MFCGFESKHSSTLSELALSVPMADDKKNEMRIWVVRSDSPSSNRPEYWFFEDHDEAVEWHIRIMDNRMDGEWDNFVEEHPEYKDKKLEDVNLN